MKGVWTILPYLCMTGLLSSQGQVVTQADLDRLGQDLKIKVKVLDNTIKGTVSHDVRITFGNNGTSDLPSSGWTLYLHSFFLLYPSIFPRPNFVDLALEKVRVSLVQGDLYSIKPLDGFKAIKPNTYREIVITAAVWSVSRTDFMPLWYVTGDDNTTDARIVQSTASSDLTYVEPFDDVRQWKRFNFDRYNPYTAQQRMRHIQVKDTGKANNLPTFTKFSANGNEQAEKLVIPTPKSVTIGNTDSNTVSIDNTWTIYNDSAETGTVAVYVSDMLNLQITNDSSQDKTIKLTIDSTIGNVPEAYNLHVIPDERTITLDGRDTRGLFYAAQSLFSILDGYNKQNIPDIRISDEPRYLYRGMHIDVARNFHGVDDIKRIINAMAMYKLNTLHLHLSDDEGWRLDIPSIRELAEVGGKRCHDLTETQCIIPQYGSGPFVNTSGTGFFQTDEYRTILRYADERHIEVIPEFDMPGHAHAAITAMEKRYRDYNNSGHEVEGSKYRLIDPDDVSKYLSVQNWMDNAINPCIESTYTFIGRVLDDLIAMHSDIQPLKAFHFGGDEVAAGAWEESVICKAFLRVNNTYNIKKGLKKYFLERVSRLTHERGIGMIGWEDGLMDGEGKPFALPSIYNPYVSANAWDNVWEWGAGPRSHTLANAGYKVIMSQATHLYFDHPYEPDPEERGLYWAPRYTDTYKTFTFMPDDLYANIDFRRSGEPLTRADVCGVNDEKCPELMKPENIIGMQGQLWSETVRTSEHLDSMIFPRFLSLVERAWHKSPFEKSDATQRENLIGQEWQAFANTIGYKELSRLENLGIKYRVPPPGARVNNGKVEVVTTFPGLKTEISFDKGKTWSEISMSNPPSFPEEGTVHLRTLSKDTNRHSRPVELFKEEPVTWTDQPDVDYIGNNVEVKVAVIDNLNKRDNYITMELHLKNTGSDAIYSGTWKIYLYSLYGLKQEVLNCGLRTGHVNGGLYYVTPNDNTFAGIKPGQTTKCTFHNEWWSVTRTDQFPNWYVSSLGMMPKVIKNTDDDTLSFVGEFNTEHQWKRTTEDRYNPLSPQQRYAVFEKSTGTMTSDSIMLLPEPFFWSIDSTSSTTDISTESDWSVHNSPDFRFASKQIAEKFNIALQDTMSQSRYINFVRKPTSFNVTESYHVEVDPAKPAITITTNDTQGALYAAQTVIALVENYGGRLKKMTIKDKPRFPYRGLMIDTARNFKPKEWIFKVLDVMTMYKMNKLHFHLTDDEGWRLEIPGIPELTKVSGHRCHSDYKDSCVIPQLGSGPQNKTSGSGFYTMKDYTDILKYAHDRHIEIIPEVDMPGHSTSSIQAMTQRDVTIASQVMHGADDVDDSFALTDADENTQASSPQHWRLNAINPCLNSTYDFVRALVQGVKDLHEPIMPLTSFHIGGDEVPDGIWDTSAACKAKYSNVTTQFLQREFVKRVADIVASFDLDVAVWEDGVYADNKPNPIHDFKSANVYVYPWDSRWEDGKAQRAAEFADEGYKVVLPLSTHLYFDQPQEQDPEERGLYWASRTTDTKKVFGFMPDDIFANADVTRMGVPVTLAEICNNSPCPMPSKKENIIGMQAVMFSETMRTEEQFHYMGFPRLLAVAERAWHKAAWENIADVMERKADMEKDFESFIDLLGEKELVRLEQKKVYYRVPPPGAKIDDTNRLVVNTRFPNHQVQYSTNDGKSWTTIQGNEVNLPPGTFTIKLRTKSTVLNHYSRVIKIDSVTVSSAVKTIPQMWLLVVIAGFVFSVLN